MDPLISAANSARLKALDATCEFFFKRETQYLYPPGRHFGDHPWPEIWSTMDDNPDIQKPTRRAWFVRISRAAIHGRADASAYVDACEPKLDDAIAKALDQAEAQRWHITTDAPVRRA